MKEITVFTGFLTIFVLLPMTIYQGYLLYSHVQATDLMWFLFWFNSTVNFLLSIIIKVIDVNNKTK